MAEMSKLESASGCLPAARSVPNMKFPRRNGGEGNFYKWLPGPAAGGLFCEPLFRLRVGL